MLIAKYVFSPEVISEGFRRYQRVRRGRAQVAAKVALLALFGAVGIIALQRDYFLTGVFLLILGLIQLASWRRIDEWFILRAYSKSPFFGQPISVSFGNTELGISSPKLESRLRWDLFTEYIRLPEGILLMQGPKSYIWVPLSAFEDLSRLDEVEDLLRRVLNSSAKSASLPKNSV
jgi:hypothetical protein